MRVFALVGTILIAESRFVIDRFVFLCLEEKFVSAIICGTG